VATGNGGNDRICTRGGNDEIRLKEGAGLVSGGVGNRDTVFLDFDEPALVSLRRHEGDVVTLGGTQTFAGDIERLVGSRRGDTVSPVQAPSLVMTAATSSSATEATTGSALAGRDRLEGGRGADDLHGGAGRDAADGGPGLDSCRAAE
jgi:Ca2+-binding RTX toxin-like protein